MVTPPAGSMGTGLGRPQRGSAIRWSLHPARQGYGAAAGVLGGLRAQAGADPEIGAGLHPQSGRSGLRGCLGAWLRMARTAACWSSTALDTVPDAARAARAATEVLAKHPAAAPAELLRLAHLALASTRGGAAAVARFSTWQAQGTFAGVGNIAARVETATSRRQLVSHNGTLGHAMRKVQEFPFDFPAERC